MSKRRTFKCEFMQRLYDLRRDTPPIGRQSGGACAAYFAGLDHPNRPTRFVRTSLAYAAWAAGVDDAKEQTT